MKQARATAYLALLGALVSCNFLALGRPSTVKTPQPTQPMPRPTATNTLEVPTPTSLDELMEPKEAILILEPGPGSRVINPIHIAGLADPTFEQTVFVRVVFDDGVELLNQPLTIAAEVGQRGSFEADIAFTVRGERNALIQVYDRSARDGGIVHLASVGVILSLVGEPDIVLGTPHPERIAIDEPVAGETVSGGLARVEGFGLASFEQTLIVEVHDAEGNVLGSVPIIVDSPEWGEPGPFDADVPYTVSVEGPGRIVVIDPLPAFDGLGHISSVEVTLAP